MRRLFRWAFNGAAAVSALLFVAACVLWVRKDTYFEGFEVTTPGGANIAIYSVSRLSISVTGNWPERKGVRYFGYRGDDPWSMRPKSVFMVLGGRTASKMVFPGGCLQGGTYSCLVDSRGTILRVPPVPDKAVYGPGSPPLPYWELRAGHWVFATAFGILSLSIVLGFFRTRVRALIRRRGGKCPSCGYDLRATPRRCPECGAVPKKIEPQTEAARPASNTGIKAAEQLLDENLRRRRPTSLTQRVRHCGAVAVAIVHHLTHATGGVQVGQEFPDFLCGGQAEGASPSARPPSIWRAHGGIAR